jgi:hypothetical protein
MVCTPVDHADADCLYRLESCLHYRYTHLKVAMQDRHAHRQKRFQAPDILDQALTLVSTDHMELAQSSGERLKPGNSSKSVCFECCSTRWLSASCHGGTKVTSSGFAYHPYHALFYRVDWTVSASVISAI